MDILQLCFNILFSKDTGSLVLLRKNGPLLRDIASVTITRNLYKLQVFGLCSSIHNFKDIIIILAQFFDKIACFVTKNINFIKVF